MVQLDNRSVLNPDLPDYPIEIAPKEVCYGIIARATQTFDSSQISNWVHL